MPEIITARDANHHFSRVLREVEAGKEFIVTRDGTPVARIIPEQPAAGMRRLTAEQEAALAGSLEWLRRGWPLGIDRLDHNELYEDARGQRVAE